MVVLTALVTVKASPDPLPGPDPVADPEALADPEPWKGYRRGYGHGYRYRTHRRGYGRYGHGHRYYG